jgi:hypothetical protein
MADSGILNDPISSPLMVSEAEPAGPNRRSVRHHRLGLPGDTYSIRNYCMLSFVVAMSTRYKPLKPAF